MPGEGLRSLTVASAADVPAVPEPATWALMVAGCGTTGYLMRRRRRTSITFTFTFT